MTEGLFISFEGVDGAGKSTQVQRAHDYLQVKGLRSLVTREPGGTPAGLAIRELVLHGMASFPSLAVTGATDVVDATDDLAPRTEALLYAADRAEHVAQVIRPAMARGDVVLCDRYIDSSLAYQAGGRDLPVDVIRRLSMWASEGLLPTRTYLLDADPSQTNLRLNHEPDRLEAAGLEFQEQVRQEFLELARQDPDRFVVIDATRPIDEVWQSIQADLDRLTEGMPVNLTPVSDQETDEDGGDDSDDGGMADADGDDSRDEAESPEDSDDSDDSGDSDGSGDGDDSEGSDDWEGTDGFEDSDDDDGTDDDQDDGGVVTGDSGDDPDDGPDGVSGGGMGPVDPALPAPADGGLSGASSQGEGPASTYSDRRTGPGEDEGSGQGLGRAVVLPADFVEDPALHPSDFRSHPEGGVAVGGTLGGGLLGEEAPSEGPRPEPGLAVSGRQGRARQRVRWLRPPRFRRNPR